MYKISIFENGLRLITYEMSHMESVSIGIWVGVGGRYEGESQNGISHLLEHIVFKATKNRTSKDLYREIEGIGGSLNAFTAEEVTCYTAKVPGEHCEKALDILSDIYLNPLIKEVDLEKEKDVIREEINMYLDMPGQYVQDLLFGLMWPDNPLGRVLIGTEKSVRGIDRKTLFEFKDSKYSLKNTVIAAAGKVRHDHLEKLVRKYFPQKDDKEQPVFEAAVSKQESSALKALKKKTEQTYLCFGIRAFRRDHPHLFALKLLSIILGENASSRLFQEVRENQGLAYDIQTTVEKFIDTGALIISAGTDPKKAERCAGLIVKEILKLKKFGVSGDELRISKDFCLGQLAMSVEKTFDHMMWMGENLVTTNKVLTVSELVEGFSRVTADDVSGLAQELFADRNLNLALIGPAIKEAMFKDLLHFD